jgi:hypothetical protein
MTALTATGCSQITENSDTGAVLLEVELVNYAWVPTFKGFVVEADGKIHSYDRKGATWTEQDSYTPGQLDEKFAPNRALVTTRPTNEVADVANKVAALPNDNLSAPKMVCADAGTLTYRAYKYDAAAARYTPVLLRMEGDRAQQNTSAAAQDLISYVRSLGLLQEFIGCDP